MIETPKFSDAACDPIEVGTLIENAEDVDTPGKVVGFRDLDEAGWAVEVQWPEFEGQGPEVFKATAPWPWEEPVWRCDEIQRADVNA